MSRSAANSRPASRSNSISEAPINIPVDTRFEGVSRPHHEREHTFGERATHWLKKDGTQHEHRHHHNDQDPKLFVSTFFYELDNMATCR